MRPTLELLGELAEQANWLDCRSYELSFASGAP